MQRYTRQYGVNKNQMYLYLFEWHFESKRFVVVRIESTLLYTGFLFLQPFPVLHQRDLHVRIYTPIRRTIIIIMVSIRNAENLICSPLFYTVQFVKRLLFLPESPPTSIFFKFLASNITTVSFPAVGT